jgi:hypothetical protein
MRVTASRSASAIPSYATSPGLPFAGSESRFAGSGYFAPKTLAYADA